ncbi:glycosyltransferase [Mycobacterium sp. SMC-4]|uniref:glycosyltransferase n=1 Tax=Mycobacterium sp. SMC-4 TaxID=2857059 RepID=UPI0021B44395|nr:glycosyltransferase [Mycobacterium sp. SMC-4]UXA20459.1 glycosyltransferase [Mycobacterium sp. SMC-4]
MKLALVGDLSGATYDLAALAATLTRRGHEVRIFTTAVPDPPMSTSECDVVAIPVDPTADSREESLMPMIGDVGRFLVQAWRDDRPVVVHCAGWAYGLAGQLAAKKTTVPTVQGFHGLSTTTARHAGEDPGDRPKIEALLAKNATAVTTACTDDKLEVIRMGCPRARVSVLPAGIEVGEVGMEAPSATEGTNRHRIVSLTHDLAAHHGLDQLIRVLPSLPSADLIIATTAQSGETELNRLHRMIERAGVSARVRVSTAVAESELSVLLRAGDVVVCPSAYDPHASLALRAMASGAAVVAVEAGGSRDAIVADVTGLLVPPDNAEALVGALRSVLRQTVLRQGMGLAGRARVRSRYCWDRIATDAEVIYQTAAQRAGNSLAR